MQGIVAHVGPEPALSAAPCVQGNPSGFWFKTLHHHSQRLVDGEQRDPCRGIEWSQGQGGCRLSWAKLAVPILPPCWPQKVTPAGLESPQPLHREGVDDRKMGVGLIEKQDTSHGCSSWVVEMISAGSCVERPERRCSGDNIHDKQMQKCGGCWTAPVSAGLSDVRVVGTHTFEEGHRVSGSTEVRRGPNQGVLSTVLLGGHLFLESRVSSPHSLGLSLFLPAFIAAVVQGRHQGYAVVPNAAL